MSNKVLETLNKIKALFADVPPAPPADAPPAPPAAKALLQYAVDGGDPVFVDISDDGLPGIDAGDMMYTDAAATTPYPDGTYKVTGTDFSFTVTGGSVASVVDPDGNGCGDPVTDAAPAAVPAEDMNKQFSEQLTALRSEFDTHKQAFGTLQASFSTLQTAFNQAKQTVDNQQSAIQQLLSVVEQLATAPVANPVEQPRSAFEKQAFEKKEAKEERMKQMAAALKNFKPQY